MVTVGPYMYHSFLKLLNYWHKSLKDAKMKFSKVSFRSKRYRMLLYKKQDEHKYLPLKLYT